MSVATTTVYCVLCGASSGLLPMEEALVWHDEHTRSCSPGASLYRVMELLEEEDPRSPDVTSPEEVSGYWEAMRLVRRAIAGEER